MTYSKNTIIGFLTIVLFANVTFAHSLDFHLCQGEFESIAFFGEKASCSKMIEVEMQAPLSCCDAKKTSSGLHFKEKPCCDNIQVIQNNVLNKSSLDVDQSSIETFNFIFDFDGLYIKIEEAEFAIEKIEIPPPPNIYYQHSQENLQVFII